MLYLTLKLVETSLQSLNLMSNPQKKMKAMYTPFKGNPPSPLIQLISDFSAHPLLCQSVAFKRVRLSRLSLIEKVNTILL